MRIAMSSPVLVILWSMSQGRVEIDASTASSMAREGWVWPPGEPQSALMTENVSLDTEPAFLNLEPLP